MVVEKRDKPYQFYRNRLTHVLKTVRVFGHELSEHARVIYSRTELALEEVVEDHPLRTHLKGIHESAMEVASLSQKLRELGNS